MIKKSGSKFVVTDSSGSKILGTHPTKEKAQKQLAAIEISKAKHMKETKQFKDFRNTLNESEYKETLTGYPNRSLDTDVGAFKFNAQFIANANAMLNALSKYSYLSTTDALVKIRARLNVLLLDFPWTPRLWAGHGQVPPAAPGEDNAVVGVFTLPLTRFGRVDGYDALTGGIRFDGRAGSQDGFQEFTLTVKVELGDDSMYRVTAFVSPKEEPVMAEEGVEVKEELVGGQKKLDANKNKRLDSQDFKLLRSKKSVKEELVGGQKKLDVNKNKKLDAQDFKVLRAKKSVKEGVTTEFTTGLPIMDPALGSNIADQSGKGTKRIKKTVDEAAAKTPKKIVKKRTTLPGAADQSAKSHAIKDRLNKYGMRW